MDSILSLARHHRIAVIEDAAEAFPSRYRGRLAGTMGVVGTYSFQATKTITTGEAWYFSRSRKTLWRKGETSGHSQRVVEMRVDCDQDAILLKVVQAGRGACHTGRRSCFYRAVPLGPKGSGPVTLEFRGAEKAFDPDAVYGDRKKR